MPSLGRSYGYSKIYFSDPEERRHRIAQFLIYKGLERADSRSTRPSWVGLRICRLKARIGKRLKRLRERMLSTMTVAKTGLYRGVAAAQFKAWKGLFCCRESVLGIPPPLSAPNVNPRHSKSVCGV